MLYRYHMKLIAMCMIAFIGIYMIILQKGYEIFTRRLKIRTLPSGDNIFNVNRTEDGKVLLPPEIKHFSNVCIERREKSGQSKASDTKITVYGTSDHHGTNKIKAVTPKQKYFSYWTLDLVPGQIPQGHRIINGTAFFATLTYPLHPYHFFNDTYFPLFSMLHCYGMIHNNVPVYLVYAPASERRRMPHRHFEWFMAFLIVDKHDYYDHIPSGTCYTDAIFGLANLYKLDHGRIPMDALRDSTPSVRCPQHLAVIIQRRRRRILNINEVQKTIARFGFNTRVEFLEDLSVPEQFLLIKCSSLLVGVKGAGLQWAQFLKKGSALVEIAWPERNWHFFFQYLELYGLRYHQLIVPPKHIILNWSDYEEHFNNGTKLSVIEKSKVIYEKFTNLLMYRTETDDNLYKWANVYVDTKNLKIVMEQVVNG